MSKNLSALVASVSLCAALAWPAQLAAQEQKEEKNEHHHYKLIDVGTFGGPGSIFSNPDSRVINNRGTAAGWADTSTPDPGCFLDCLVNNAFVWKNGVTTDLGAQQPGRGTHTQGVNNRVLMFAGSE